VACCRGPDKIPKEARGTGLPSNLINDLLVGRNGTIWVATTTGLARSLDKGSTWQYMRGADYTDKACRFYGIPEPKDWPAKWKEAEALLTEDYVTRLARMRMGIFGLGFGNLGAHFWTVESKGFFIAAGRLIITVRRRHRGCRTVTSLRCWPRRPVCMPARTAAVVRTP